MATYVLVHGAWGGGWYWERTARLLREAGHDVFTPTLTGLGERAHLLSPEVGLDMHVADIMAMLRCERLSDVVLVGHSYGGMVVTAVADRVAERIGTLVYLDAALPRSGEAMIDFVLPERRAKILEGVQARGEGWKVPPVPAEHWGIDDPEDRRWLDALFGFHPFRTMTDRIALSGRHLSVARKVYILASNYDPSPFRQFARRTRADPEWVNHEIATHHFAMVQKPRETADLLLRHA